MSKVEPSPAEFYKDLGENSMMLRLMRINASTLDYVDHVVIKKGLKPVSCFSLDGSMFAYLVIEDEHVEKISEQRKKEYLAKKHHLSDTVKFKNKEMSRLFKTENNVPGQVRETEEESSSSEDEKTGTEDDHRVGRRKLYIVAA
jgi:hypothetical protein